MKRLLTALFLISSFQVMGQKTVPTPPEMPRNDEDNKVYYMEVVTMDGIDKDELFRRARIWMKSYYKNPTGLIDQMDSLTGTFILKPQFSTYRTLKNDVKAQSAIVRYTLVMGFKDGRYRYEIKDLNLKEASYFPIEKLFNENDPNVADHYNTLNEADRTILQTINDLRESMKEPSAKVKKDDW